MLLNVFALIKTYNPDTCAYYIITCEWRNLKAEINTINNIFQI